MKNVIFQILLARLKWPDMLVREQTFHAVKDFLIANPNFKNNFLIFLEKQHLESKVLEILAIVYLINQKQKSYFSLAEIEQSIKAHSFLSDICLGEIFNIKFEKQNRPWHKNHSEPVPNGFKIDTINYQKNGLVSNNLEHLKKICNIDLNLEKQFEFELKKIIDKEQCSYYGKIDYFCEIGCSGSPNIKLLQDDIQISAFLRLISFCKDIYNLPDNLVLLLLQDFIPIDFGLLELKPTAKPIFLDKLIDYNFKQWNFGEDDYIPVYLSCPLKIKSDTLFDKEIIAIDIYPVHLSYTPKSLENYFEFFRRGKLWEKMKKIPWHSNIRKIIIPEDIPEYFIGLFHKCCNYIQRMYTIERDLFIPNEKTLEIEIEKDKLIFKSNGQIIGYMQYWYDNYNTFSYIDATVCSGVITYLHKDYINKINMNNDITILINYKVFKSHNKEKFELTSNLYYSVKIQK
ncbi:hypothetical protein HDR58_07015 [bacterium]|nr:hypothetical protein [bacterium]